MKRSIVSPVEPLIRTIPFGPATYILMTGEMIDAQEAPRVNLVTKAVPLPELMPAAMLLLIQPHDPRFNAMLEYQGNVRISNWNEEQ